MTRKRLRWMLHDLLAGLLPAALPGSTSGAPAEGELPGAQGRSQRGLELLGGGDDGFAGRLAEAGRSMRLCFFTRWFVRLRWLAGAAVCAALGAGALLHIELPYGRLALLTGVLLLGNLLFARRGRTESCSADDVSTECRRCLHQHALLQIVFDLVLLFGLLHLTGGLLNPWLPLVFLHVVLSGILLEPSAALAVGLLPCALAAGLAGLQGMGLAEGGLVPDLLAAVPPLWRWRLLAAVAAGVGITSYLLQYLTIFIMTQLRHRRALIVELSGELDKRNRALLRLDGMRRQILAVASHDLKSPLAAIESLLMLLRDGHHGPLSETGLHSVERCIARADGLRAFVDDILDYTAVETGRIRQDLHRCDLTPTLRAALDSARVLAERKDQTLEAILPDALPEMTAAPERLAQVLDNLLSNATKYTPEGGRIVLRVEVREAELHLLVSDTGMGIDAAAQAQLFTPFFRAPNAKRSGVPGSGLGLSLVYAIVKAHGGGISAESTLGEGTTIHVRLPLGTHPPPPDQPASGEAPFPIWHAAPPSSEGSVSTTHSA